MPNETTSSTRTIFLSHSSKDIDKVRKIRNILEALDYEPLLFHMKCLDDDNEVLEEFIKKEIDARNIFVYCRSENSEASVWVQKELAYIKEASNKRLYEIDIEQPLSETMVCFLNTIAEIIKKNKVFISCSHADRAISDAVTRALTKNGYDVIRYNNICLGDGGKQYEQHEKDISSISKNGIFLPIITTNFLKSMYCMSEVEKVLYESEQHDVIFKPICVGISPTLAQLRLPQTAQKYNMLGFDAENLHDYLSSIHRTSKLYRISNLKPEMQGGNRRRKKNPVKDVRTITDDIDDLLRFLENDNTL